MGNLSHLDEMTLTEGNKAEVERGLWLSVAGHCSQHMLVDMLLKHWG